MNELERALTADSAAAPPSHILDSLPGDLAHRQLPGAPHTIYAELWHIAFWQQISLDWARGIETPIPTHASGGFPDATQTAQEPWPDLCRRFFNTLTEAAELTRDSGRLDQPIRCPSPPGVPTRTMSLREQLESLSAHNAYHFGRIVLLRQLLSSWPPPSGGFTW